MLSDEDVQRIAVAVVDEQERRRAERLAHRDRVVWAALLEHWTTGRTDGPAFREATASGDL